MTDKRPVLLRRRAAERKMLTVDPEKNVPAILAKAARARAAKRRRKLKQAALLSVAAA